MKSGYQRLIFFPGTFILFLVLEIFLTKEVCLEKKNKCEIFSPILVVIQIYLYCCEERRGSDARQRLCTHTGLRENGFSGVVVSGHSMEKGIDCLLLYPAVSK